MRKAVFISLVVGLVAATKTAGAEVPVPTQCYLREVPKAGGSLGLGTCPYTGVAWAAQAVGPAPQSEGKVVGASWLCGIGNGGDQINLTLVNDQGKQVKPAFPLMPASISGSGEGQASNGNALMFVPKLAAATDPIWFMTGVERNYMCGGNWSQSCMIYGMTGAEDGRRLAFTPFDNNETHVTEGMFRSGREAVFSLRRGPPVQGQPPPAIIGKSWRADGTLGRVNEPVIYQPANGESVDTIRGAAYIPDPLNNPNNGQLFWVFNSGTQGLMLVVTDLLGNVVRTHVVAANMRPMVEQSITAVHATVHEVFPALGDPSFWFRQVIHVLVTDYGRQKNYLLVIDDRGHVYNQTTIDGGGDTTHTVMSMKRNEGMVYVELRRDANNDEAIIYAFNLAGNHVAGNPLLDNGLRVRSSDGIGVAALPNKRVMVFGSNAYGGPAPLDSEFWWQLYECAENPL